MHVADRVENTNTAQPVHDDVTAVDFGLTLSHMAACCLICFAVMIW
jgi:hypothetical protein